jgi:hypothetical protein
MSFRDITQQLFIGVLCERIPKHITLIVCRLIVVLGLLIDACEVRTHASSLARLFAGCEWSGSFHRKRLLSWLAFTAIMSAESNEERGILPS